jgi:hypothetical protein
VERLCDTVVRLESFAGSDKETNPTYKDYHGTSPKHSATILEKTLGKACTFRKHIQAYSSLRKGRAVTLFIELEE